MFISLTSEDFKGIASNDNAAPTMHECSREGHISKICVLR